MNGCCHSQYYHFALCRNITFKAVRRPALWHTTLHGDNSAQMHTVKEKKPPLRI